MDILKDIILAILPAFVVGVMLANFNKKQKKKEEKEKSEEQRKLKAEKLKLSLFLTSAQLSRAVAYAYKRGEPNGEMEECIEEYEKALKNFRELEREQIANI